MPKYLKVEDIVVKPGRQRKKFDRAALHDLEESIVTNSLLHAPVMRETPGPDGLTYTLVAGERRLRAMTELHEFGRRFNFDGAPVPLGYIPYVALGDLDPLQAWQAELEENIQREDLTWQERAAATEEWAAMRNAQAKAAGINAPRVPDLTAELRPEENRNAAHTAVRGELLIARHLGDPEVAKAPTIKEALKILKKREASRLHASTAAIVGKTFSTSDHTLLNEDSLAWMATQPPGQFDVVLTDPIYGIDAHLFGDSGIGVNAEAHRYDDSYENWLATMSVFPALAFALTKPDAHAYIFCDIGRFHELRSRMADAGWKVFRTPLIWHNANGYRAPWPFQGPQRHYECILYAVKGERKTLWMRGDVLVYPTDPNLGHNAQKPIALLKDLLGRSALPGQRVLDPFMGSGSTAIACHELQLYCTGLEILQTHYGLAVSRLAALKGTPK